MENNIFNIKMSRCKLVRTRGSTALNLPLQLVFPDSSMSEIDFLPISVQFFRDE
jgi:hypothetical protein